ncbi:MAG: tyrosine-type recombinase/integrase [Verrucomicrobiota bacterium]
MADVSKGWPKTIEVSGVRVRIYRAERKVGGRPYVYFRISYFEPGYGRRMRDFAREENAIAEAKSIATKIGSGRTDAITLTRDEVSEYRLCVAKLEGTGHSLFSAVEGFLAARKATEITPKTVPEVVEEYLAELESRGLSDAHLKHEQHVGRRLSTSITGPLASVSPSVFKSWLYGQRLRDGGEPSRRYLANLHRSFSALCNFAARRRYLTRDAATLIAEEAAPKAEVPKCDVFTPDEFRRLLEASSGETRVALVLCGFCGVRTAELLRLTWGDVNLGQRVVVIGPDIAKTAARRVIPLCPAAAAWLAPIAGREGKVFPGDPRTIAKVGESIGIAWKRNALRHEFCSARLAVTKNAPEVAFEAGNSPAMIQKHYRAMLTEAEGQAWFNIMPPT